MNGWGGWAVFAAVVGGMMVLDLGLVHRKAHEVRFKEAMAWTIAWIALALAFNAFVLWTRGKTPAIEFLTCYLTEEALSVDNMFVFLVIFKALGVPSVSQHRVLFWGILGALIMRAGFILAGVGLIQMFEWTIYVFGAFLLITGIKLAFQKGTEVHPERSLVLRLSRRFLRVTTNYEESRFFVRQEGRMFVTPLLIALLAVETTDVLFAVDSVPAALAITQDTFVLYTSNIFAILGLRSLFFVLSGLMRFLHYLHYGLAAILAFIGIKMIVAHHYPISVSVSLGAVTGILGVSVILSLIAPRRGAESSDEK